MSSGVVFPSRASRASIAPRSSKDRSSSSVVDAAKRSFARAIFSAQTLRDAACLGVERSATSVDMLLSCSVFLILDKSLGRPILFLHEICIIGFGGVWIWRSDLFKTKRQGFFVCFSSLVDGLSKTEIMRSASFFCAIALETPSFSIAPRALLMPAVS